MKRDDTLWKSILEDIFEDFLIFFYPDAGSFFDFRKISNTSTRSWDNCFRRRVIHTRTGL
ncbi:MAG: hypothetical protein BGO21_06375 [Dyadobacter sp. 50-39]|uniref:hypothetical protein n=1 Tax=Dyadobacter sp. 50-39 TaxID=1895756 RepID=UPI000958F5A8|nr:hypothetical protein [Dyadobacter sp. 50-39]OJV12367.1 MAG: hypothetical protein BGO21_06375 [Dyadobacter sp. 50-39]